MASARQRRKKAAREARRAAPKTEAPAEVRVNHTAKAEADAVKFGLAETARLERARGGEVERGKGPMRILSRDGLRSLLESGALEQPEYEAGMFYRRCFETLASGPRSCLNREAHGGTGNADDIRAYRAEKLARWEALAATGRQLWVLRLVAGQGRTIRSLSAGSGSAKVTNTRALAEILTAIAKERGLRR